MKKITLILFLFAIAISVNAQFRRVVEQDVYARAANEKLASVADASQLPAINRVLTNEEKQILQSNSAFIYECQWALKNFASFWADAADANTKVGQVGYTQWAKNYVWASRTLDNISMVDNNSQIPSEFAVLLKGMFLWDSAVTPFNASTVVTYMVANSKFDELATAWVTSKTVKPSF